MVDKTFVPKGLIGGGWCSMYFVINKIVFSILARNVVKKIYI
jgi:hypothetical protein